MGKATWLDNSPYRWPYKPNPAQCRLNPEHPLAAALACMWTANEAGGSSVGDLSPNRNAGTFNASAPSWSVKTNGPSLQWSGGANQEVSRSSATNLPIGGTTPFTVEMWAAPTVVVSLCTLFGFGSEPNTINSNKDGRYFMSFGGAGNNHIYFFAGSGDWDTGVTWDTDGVLRQYAFTYDGTNLRLYRNGVLAAGPSAPGAALATAGTSVVAGSHHPSGVACWTGAFSLGRIYSKCMAAGEIAALYQNPYAMILPPTSRRYFPFGAATGKLLLNRRRALLAA